MTITPGLAARALAEAGRHARVLDVAAADRLATAASAAGATDPEALATWLEDSHLPLNTAAHLVSLLPPSGLSFGHRQALARLAGPSTAPAWLVADGERLAVAKLLMTGQDDADRERLLREAAIMCGLRHAHVIQCLDFGSAANGQPFLVHEHLDSGDLADLLQVHGGTLGEAHAITLLAQLAGALGAAHRVGLMHRDIAPGNVLVDAMGAVKLVNFGLARGGDMTQLTLAGASDSTLYLAPEQVLGGTVDARSDIYALGCLLFFCLAGRPPFGGRRPQVLHAKLSGSTPDLRALRPTASAAAVAVIATCLAKEPAERYPDCEALSRALGMARVALVGDGSSVATSTIGLDDRRGGDTGRASSRGRLALAGRLDDLPMGQVLQTLARLRGTGVLRLIDDAGTRGIVIDGGLPIGLAFDHRDDLLGLLARLPEAARPPRLAERLATASPSELLEEVVTAAAIDPAGLEEAMAGQTFSEVVRRFLPGDEAFEFVAAESEPGVAAVVARARRRPARITSNHLLAEGARQLEEATRIARRLPGPWSLPEILPERAAGLCASHARFPGSAIVAVIDGRTALRDLPGRAFCSSFDVDTLLVAAVADGAVRFAGDDDLLTRSDLAITAGDWAGAEAPLRALLAANPDHPRAAALFATALAEAELQVVAPPAQAAARPVAAPAALVGDPREALAVEWISLLSAPDGSGPAVHLVAADELTLGKVARDPVRATLRIYPVADHVEACQQISRTQARIERLPDGQAALRDLGSGNGTFVDGARLAADAPLRLAPREHHVAIAGVLDLRVRPIEIGARAPALPAALPAGALAAVAVRRVANREELAYALVFSRITIGGADADIPLPGLPLGAALALLRWEGRWWWCAGERAEWRPVVEGATLRCGPCALTVARGEHRHYG